MKSTYTGKGFITDIGIILVALAIIGLVISGCEKSTNPNEENPNEDNGPVDPIVTDTCDVFFGAAKDFIPASICPDNFVAAEFRSHYIDTLPNDTIMVSSARVSGDTLIVQVEYPGGCGNHTFALVTQTGYYKSNPPQLAVYLVHDRKSDLCMEIQPAVLSFNLQPVREFFLQKTSFDPGDVLVIRLNDKHPDGYDWGRDDTMWLYL